MLAKGPLLHRPVNNLSGRSKDLRFAKLGRRFEAACRSKGDGDLEGVAASQHYVEADTKTPQIDCFWILNHARNTIHCNALWRQRMYGPAPEED